MEKSKQDEVSKLLKNIPQLFSENKVDNLNNLKYSIPNTWWKDISINHIDLINPGIER